MDVLFRSVHRICFRVAEISRRRCRGKEGLRLAETMKCADFDRRSSPDDFQNEVFAPSREGSGGSAFRWRGAFLPIAHRKAGSQRDLGVWRAAVLLLDPFHNLLPLSPALQKHSNIVHLVNVVDDEDPQVVGAPFYANNLTLFTHFYSSTDSCNGSEAQQSEQVRFTSPLPTL